MGQLPITKLTFTGKALKYYPLGTFNCFTQNSGFKLFDFGGFRHTKVRTETINQSAFLSEYRLLFEVHAA